MLSKPNVKEIMPKVGNRYQSVLAIAKRAREITDDIVLKGDIVEEKPVNLAIKDFNKGKFKISQ